MTADWSLRGRLQRRVALAVVLGWTASLVLGVLVIADETNELLDDTLAAQARLTAHLIGTGGGRTAPEVESGLILRVIRPGMASEPAPWPALAGDGAATVAGWHVHRVSDPASGVVVELGQAGAARWHEIVEAARALFLLMLPTLAVVMLALRRTVRSSLAAVIDFADQLRQRRAGELGPVAAAADLPRELAPIPQALGDYLARIDALLQSERQFAANAAHELRTPLAAALAQAQLIAENPAEPEASARLVGALAGLSRLVERLLELARAEAGAGASVTAGGAGCDLLRVARLLRAEIGAGQVVLDDSDLDRLASAVDADVAALILGNLLRNACDHGTGGVMLRLRPGPLVEVENRARPGAAFRHGRFEKGAASQGAGLGLVIAETLAERNGVALDFAITDGLARVRAHFPPPA